MQFKRHLHTAACRFVFALVVLTALLLAPFDVLAENPAPPQAEIEDHNKAGRQSSPSLLGMLGLNTIPNARMDEEGTIRIGASTLDPYYHGFIGLQVAKPLYIQLRQTGEVSRASGMERYYPGMDVKLRLVEESRYVPELSVGFNSLFGDKRFSSEYIAASKRYGDFDFTAGIGWGRLGSAGHWKNPLRKLSSHFDKERDYTSTLTSTAEDLFTGKDIGFFGGVEYFPSWTGFDGLSFKADWGADRYPGERQAFGMQAPAPWSLGVNYNYKDMADLSIGTVGTDKLFARLTLQTIFENWPWSAAPKTDPPLMHAYRTGPGYAGEMALHAQRDGMVLHSPHLNESEASAVLELDPDQPASLQIGRAARHMGNHAGQDAEKITITPYRHHLRGPTLTLIRGDLEKAAARGSGSAEEIWRDAEFKDTPPNERGLPPHITNTWIPRFALEFKTDFMSDDHKFLHRTSLLIEEEKLLPWGFLAGAGLRINLYDNLNNITKTRAPALKTTRSAEDLYAAPYVSLERSFLSWLHTPKTNLHFAVSAGYLEETFAGVGGEVLYRPFGKTWAAGVEGWRLYPRIAGTDLNQEIFWEDDRWTGHLNLYYEPPDTDYTVYAKAGRYISEDFGATIGVRRHFPSGLKFDAYTTYTDEADPDGFGGSLNLTGGIRLTLPIGNLYKHIPKGTEVRVKMEPMARDEGQLLDKPIDLYDLTEPMSYRHLSRNWGALLE